MHQQTSSFQMVGFMPIDIPIIMKIPSGKLTYLWKITIFHG